MGQAALDCVAQGRPKSKMWHSLRKVLKDCHRGGEYNNGTDIDQQDAEDQGADIHTFGSGSIGLGSSHTAHLLPVLGLHKLGIGNDTQATDIQKEFIEQGPDDMVRHRDLSGHVHHSGPYHI